MDNEKLFRVNAGYRKSDIGTLFYYVVAPDKHIAKWLFANTVSWLTVYGISEVECESEINNIINNNKIICLRRDKYRKYITSQSKSM